MSTALERMIDGGGTRSGADEHLPMMTEIQEGVLGLGRLLKAKYLDGSPSKLPQHAYGFSSLEGPR